MADNKYCYPGTNVLKNKLNITDGNELNAAERQITVLVEAELRTAPVRGNLDYVHLRSVHYELFFRLYDWAGKPRVVDIGKGVQFASARFLDVNATKIFMDLRRDNYLIGLPYEKAIGKLAYYLGEINVLHPFREGNGRAQRLFISYVAQATGISLDFTKCETGRMLEASKYSAIACDNTKFEAVLKDISAPMAISEQKAFLKSMSPKILEVFEKTGNIPDRIQECSSVGPKPRHTMAEWKTIIAEEKANNNSQGKEPISKIKSDKER